VCGPQPDVPVVVTWNDEKGFELWDQQSAGGVIATICHRPQPLEESIFFIPQTYKKTNHRTDRSGSLRWRTWGHPDSCCHDPSLEDLEALETG